MESGARRLCDAFPDRFLLGLGVSHAPSVAQRGHEYGKPLTAMRGYLDAMDAQPGESAPRILAALGPRMLDLARERSLGAHPYFVPPEHTAIARKRLGPGKLLCVEQAVAPDERAAEAYMERYYSLDNYRRNLERLGVGPEPPRLVAFGEEEAVERVRAHLDAGADHVCIQPLPMGEPELDQLRRLAPALLAV
jgi:probable F420-dependent oxidoreductase